MTVSVGRNSLSLGWPTVIVIAGALITGTWKISGATNALLYEVQDLSKQIKQMRTDANADHDQIITLSSTVHTLNIKVDSLTDAIDNHKARTQTRRSTGRPAAFYVERKVGGKIVLTKVNN